ncbi:phosphate metabolism protein 7, partial [Dipsacomyces acuminosporus]
MGGNDVHGLARLSIGNVQPYSSLLWIHIVFFIVFVAWVMSNIFGELKVYARLRMWWLTNPERTKNCGASTVLVSSLPDNLIDQDDKLSSIFGIFPGGVRQIIVNRNVSELEDIVNKRDSHVKRLEKLLTNYAVQCEKAYVRSVQNGAPYSEPKRPLLRESKIPFKGPKIDAITYHATEIEKLNSKIAKFGGDASKFKRQSSAFVMFNEQIAAHMSAQSVLDYKPFSMNTVSTEVNPDDIIWSNLNMNPYDRRLRGYISFGISIGLTIVWTILTATLNTLIGVNVLTKLADVGDERSKKWLDMFTGIVPTLLIATLIVILPIFLRLLLRLEGTPSVSE